MQPVEFDVSVIPKKVFMGYCRYAGWNRAKGIWVSLVLGIIYLGLCGQLLFRDPAAWNTSIVALFFLSGILHALLPLLAPVRIFNTRKYILRQQWRYAFSEHAVEADMMGGVFFRWEYYALACVHEAKDAFYLVLNERTGEAMIIPKQALMTEQCRALVEALQRGVPGGKFTRWKDV